MVEKRRYCCSDSPFNDDQKYTRLDEDNAGKKYWTLYAVRFWEINFNKYYIKIAIRDMQLYGNICMDLLSFCIF